VKFVTLLALITLSACSVNPSQRSPSSILSESTRISLDGDAREDLHLDAKVLKDELNEHSFREFILQAQARGYGKIVFDPNYSTFRRFSMTDSTSIAGDFFLLIGTKFTGDDEIIRRGDYDDVYVTARRLSWLKFRVIINLVASVDDLRSALANKNPTIITWTSHGNETGFYDFNQIKVPPSIFKNTSPSVYQFILTACNGFSAMQDTYKPHIPATMKYWSWDRLVYHPTDLKKLLEDSTIWNPFMHYPGELTYKNLVCKKSGESYQITHARELLPIGGGTYDNLENCNYIVANSNDHFVCYREGEKWQIYNKKHRKVIAGTAFDYHYDCNSRISNTYAKKLCRRLASTNKFHFIDGETNVVSTESFDGLNACYDHLYTLSE
jgi:hypothetical protein